MSHILSYTETRSRLMDRVQWEKIESVMKHLNWTWVFTNYEVPTIDQMKSCVDRLFDTVWEKMHSEGNTDEWYSSSTGGFEVRAFFKVM
jgi:hypothetical protein